VHIRLHSPLIVCFRPHVFNPMPGD
jgi:hypothetical protein